MILFNAISLYSAVCISWYGVSIMMYNMSLLYMNLKELCFTFHSYSGERYRAMMALLFGSGCPIQIHILSPFMLMISLFCCSNDIPHDFECTLEIYCHKSHEDLAIANTPKKINKKMTDLSESFGRIVGKDSQDL